MKPIHLNQMSLITAISKEVERQFKQQGIKDTGVPPHCFNGMIEGANAVVKAFAEKEKPAVQGMGLLAWLNSHDTGTSSKTMASHLMGASMPSNHYSHPLDNSDFGRCHRFLLAVPEAREKLPKMAELGDVWGKLVDHWDELTVMYEADPSSRALYDKMKSLGC